MIKCCLYSYRCDILKRRELKRVKEIWAKWFQGVCDGLEEVDGFS